MLKSIAPQHSITYCTMPIICWFFIVLLLFLRFWVSLTGHLCSSNCGLPIRSYSFTRMLFWNITIFIFWFYELRMAMITKTKACDNDATECFFLHRGCIEKSYTMVLYNLRHLLQLKVPIYVFWWPSTIWPISDLLEMILCLFYCACVRSYLLYVFY